MYCLFDVWLLVVVVDMLCLMVMMLLLLFDLVVWDWWCVLMLFGFDYMIECYIFEYKWCYGYFCLFVLYCGWLVGCVDVKVYCMFGMFELKVVYVELGVCFGIGFVVDVVKVVKKFVVWYGMLEVMVRYVLLELVKVLVDM